VRVYSGLSVLFCLALHACGADPREGSIPAGTIWPDAPASEPAPDPIAFADRASGHEYGLPAKGEHSLAELIALFPQQPLGVNDPDIYVAKGVDVTSDQCRGGQVVVQAGLPMTLEAVVTLYPREYIKLALCGQDERHYGVFTVEDDTGGLIILRDSRVANYSYGDHIRLTVSGIMLTYGKDVDTRAVLLSDIEPTGETGPVLFTHATKGFSSDDTGHVRRVTGYVWQSPSNDNFSELVLIDKQVTGDTKVADLKGDALQCALTCSGTCALSCNKPELCAEGCAELCKDASAGQKIPAAEVPMCWIVGMGSDLGKRGISFARGTHLTVTGPVVNNYEREIWVLDPRQVETLSK
jgi:hypothetical protein